MYASAVNIARTARVSPATTAGARRVPAPASNSNLPKKCIYPPSTWFGNHLTTASSGGRRRGRIVAARAKRDGEGADSLPILLPWARERADSAREGASVDGGTSDGDSVRANQCAPGYFDLVQDEGDDDFSDADDGLAWFKTALGAFMYDKGYRQAFALLGFPGPDAEHLMALSQLRPARTALDEPDATLLELSCGPGMFAEKFARGSEFPRVVATDYAEAMCRQTRERIASSPNARAKDTAVVRADVGNLPFDDDAFAAVHSAAGIHCWPEPARGLEEVSRVLKLGGTFVASTVVLPEKARAKMTAKGLDAATYSTRARKQNMPFWDHDAVLAMWRSTPGFEDAEIVHAEKAFVMISVTKGSRDGLGNNAVSRPERVKVPEETEKTDDETPEILNQWWPVAFEHQLDADGDKLAVALFGEPIVVYRTSGGVVNCVQDRCAHKSCPLSLGYVRDGKLLCRYHGWAYGEGGELVDVPALEPGHCPKASVPQYPCHVADGVVHVWLGDPKACGRSELPGSVVATKSMKGVETLSWPRLTETREWDGVPWHSAVEITQDFTHLQFVHPNTQAGRAPLLVGGLTKFDTEGHPPGGFVAEYVGGSGKGGGRVTFIPPSTVMNESFFVDEDAPDGKKAFPLCFVFRFIPTAPGKTAILVQTHQKLFPHISDRFAKALMNMTKVMSQDQLVLAAQRLRVAQGSPQWNLPIESDKHLLHFTKWRVAAEGPDGPWFRGYDRPVPSAELAELDDVLIRIQNEGVTSTGQHLQRPDASGHPRPFHRPKGRHTVRRGAASNAGVDKSGVDVEKPLRDLVSAGQPAWHKAGVPLWLADAMNAARGSNVVKRVVSGMRWGEGTWQKKDDEDGENLLPESAPKAPFANNAIAFNRGSKARLSEDDKKAEGEKTASKQ
jgi:phenylpropionate dioxygenase-like ring-hydroxylating dioxygenase large terminal subunit/2-polyprenyl-3-methyl-5-hydroxy-6-metoxy-1,4-benzoquinol methylase